ncbi:MAG: hypothetical protein R3B13_27765 [Polyangiaceae bacterium]
MKVMGRMWAVTAMVAWTSAGMLGCGDDDSSSAAATGGAAGSGASGGAAGNAGSAGSAASGGSAGISGGAGTGGANVQIQYVAMVRGTLLASTLAESKTTHDQIAQAGEAPAKQAGDIGHDAFLGTTLLGTTENEFLAVDRWQTDGNMDAFYSNPTLQQGFATLIAAPLVLESFACPSDWHGWGALTAGKGQNRVYVVVRGKLKESDTAMARQQHNAVAQGGEAAATQAGDIAHVACIGRADPQEFLAVDVWSDTTNLETLYQDPNFQAAFATLFSAAPTLGVYASTDWHQW